VSLTPRGSGSGLTCTTTATSRDAAIAAAGPLNVAFLGLEDARAAATAKRALRDSTRGGMDMPPDDGVAHDTLDPTEAAVSVTNQVL
jgi:hypothetical protein